jgi:hypothetical protein
MQPEMGEPSESGRGSLLRYWLSAAVVLITFAYCVPAGPSADMWWHLSTGHYILQNRTIPHSDPFSSTAFEKPWTTQEWLSEVVFQVVYRAGGSAGLLLMAAVVLTLAFLLAYGRSGGTALGRVLALGLGVWASRATFLVRPQIFTFLLEAAFLWILSRSQAPEKRKWLVALPVLMVLWVNLHAGSMLGPGLVLLAAAGAVADWIWSFEERRAMLERVRELGITLAMCLAVVPLNPNGAKMYTYPFETLKSAAMQTGIFEWMSPNFHSPMFYPLAALLFLTVAAVALSGRRPRPSEMMLFVVFGLAALRSMRNLTLFVLVAFPLLGEYAEIPGWNLPELGARWRRVLQVVVALGAAVIAAEVASNGLASDLQMERARFPEKAAAFLEENRLPTPLLNSYDFGGYLIWKLYPGYRVYIDGRADLYGDEFLEKFIQLYDVQVDPRPQLNEAGIRTVIVEPGSALAAYLRAQSDWKRVFEDRVAVVFTR